MLGAPSRHDGLPNNQAARDRQRERQRQERAQMLVSDDTGVIPNIQDLFNAPVKVNPSVEDPTSIEIRKTFGSYDSARPFLTEKNGALQGRLIGVDQTLNAAAASEGGTSSGIQILQSSSGDPEHRGSASAGGSGVGHKPPGIPPPRPPQPPTSSNPSTTKPDCQNLFKHIPPPPSQTQSAAASASQKPPVLNSQSQASSIPALHAIGQAPILNHIQNSINSVWNLPTPLSPFPVRKQTKLSTTTLPITFVTSSSLNTLSTVTSEIGELPKQPSKTTNHNTYQSTSANNSIKPLATNTSGGSGLGGQSELKSVANPSAPILGAPVTEKSNSQLTFKKPLERNDSRVELDNMIREMTDVRSPLAAILPKDSPPKKVATRRSSKSDERTIEALEGMHELKNSVSSPLSGMNSSSSSSGSDSSDSDSDTDSSTSGSELTTPSNTPVKNLPPTTTAPTTRSPTERESWSLSSFVPGFRKEKLIDAASTSLEPHKAAITNLETFALSAESSRNAQKPEQNVSPSSTTGSLKFLSTANSTILESSKALIKTTEFVKPSVPQNKLNSKDSVTNSKGPTGKLGLETKGKVPPLLGNLSKVSSALLKHKDPTLSGSSDEEEDYTKPLPPPPKEKEKEKSPPKTRTAAKRPATTTVAESPAKKKLRRNSIKTPSPLPPTPIIPVAEKGGPKGEEKQGKNKSLDRNKNDMIGRLFRPKKDKSDEGGKDNKESPTPSVTPREEKSPKSKGKPSPSPNRVSGKDSLKKSGATTRSAGISNASSTAMSSASSNTKANGDVKNEKHETKGGNISGTTSSSNSKPSTSRGKGVPGGKVSGSSTTTVGTSAGKQAKPNKNHSIAQAKKNGGESTSPSPPKGKRVSGSGNTNKSASVPSPKAKKSPKEPFTKSKSAAKTKTESPTVPKSSSTSSTPTKPSPSSSKSKPSSSKSVAKSMPPPPPPPPPSTPHGKDIKGNKKEDKGGAPATVKSPSTLLIKIPLNMLPRVDKVKGQNSSSALTATPKKSEGKGSREDKKGEGRPKGHVPFPSLVGSSVEDVTDTHIVPSSKVLRGSGGGGVDQATPTKDLSSSSSPSSRKRNRNRSHASSKKPRLKETTEVDIKADSEKNLTCDLSSSALTPYTGSATPAKTPPDPPDSSLNPTHSSSPTLALPQQPVYASYFEKVEHQEDYFAYDQTHYLDRAKTLKHRADKEETGVPQVLMYMDAVLFFILSGILMERTELKNEAYGMYKQTLNLIRQISARPRVGTPDDPQEVKLLVLNLRLQALLFYQVYKFQSVEIIESSRYLTDYFRTKHPQDYIPPHPVIRSPQTSLSTPSPHSPGLSPAGSGPASVGSAPSIHSPHHQTHPPQVVITKHLYQRLSRYCPASNKLVLAHDNWEAADALVEQNNVQDFFISIDRLNGPLTLHSSLLDLVRYVRSGLKVLNQNLENS